MAQREASHLSQAAQHVSLVRPYSVRLTPDNLQLVLQHCSGGTLESYCKQHRVSEDLACFFFHQLVAVLEHLHSSKIAYRDMKLQNVLLRSKPSRSSPPRLVLCDLGTAKAWTGQQMRCETFVGTPGFMAPQVLASMFNGLSTPRTDASSDSSQHSRTSQSSSNTYDARKADIWALGALLHYMLHRQLPYGYDSFAPLLPPQEALLTLLQLENQHTWKDAAGAHGLQPISAEAQDLLDQLLHQDEQQRISIRRIKLHPWFNRPLPAQYAKALKDMQQEQAALSAAAACSAADAASSAAQARELAGTAVDRLFELSRCPAALQRLREQQQCLTVPLSSSGADAELQQQLQRALQRLDDAADAAGLLWGSIGIDNGAAVRSRSSVELRSRLCNASGAALVQQPLKQQQQVQQLQPKEAPAPLSRDDTCFLVQVSTA
uniref:Protein kinase domain-containing protein n=1 Tax=Tetradesmus obliquus TaxID=3088 RepID=A0A383V7L8_TETOB|eukprot:jgi/Sobl393_1/8715/SZX60930.1